MTRLYDNSGFARRQNISVGILIVVVIYGIWELWAAFTSEEGDATGTMFGILFVAGGLYGAKTIWDENRDLPASFDVDFDAGKVVVTLWRPFRTLVVGGNLDAFSNWRYWVKVGKRNMRQHYLVASHAAYPHPLYFEIQAGKPVPDGFRRLAPEAVADFEENTAGAGAT